MLKKMHPDKALELRATLKALREQLHSDSGEHMKRRKASMHPELTAMKVEKMDMEPRDSDHPDAVRMDETHVKGDGEHPGHGWQPDDDIHGKEMYSEGGEVNSALKGKEFVGKHPKFHNDREHKNLVGSEFSEGGSVDSKKRSQSPAELHEGKQGSFSREGTEDMLHMPSNEAMEQQRKRGAQFDDGGEVRTLERRAENEFPVDGNGSEKPGAHMDDDKTIEAHRKLLERLRNDY